MIDELRSLSARLIAASPLSMSISEARTPTRERRRKLLGSPPAQAAKAEPDFSPQPLPVDLISDPVGFGKSFWEKRSAAPPAPAPKSKLKKPQPGRRPVGELPAAAGRFTVIDGNGGDNDPPRDVQ